MRLCQGDPVLETGINYKTFLVQLYWHLAINCHRAFYSVSVPVSETPTNNTPQPLFGSPVPRSTDDGRHDKVFPFSSIQHIPIPASSNLTLFPPSIRHPWPSNNWRTLSSLSSRRQPRPSTIDVRYPRLLFGTLVLQTVYTSYLPSVHQCSQ